MEEKLEFKRDGYFFAMVQTYYVTIVGLTFYDHKFEACFNELQASLGKEIITEIGSREIGSIKVSLEDKIKLMKSGSMGWGYVVDRLAFMLLNIAYSAVEDLVQDTTNPMYQFFRHLRNAASHGGKWSFKGKEPTRYHAEWRGRKVEKTLQGRPIWDLNLGPGDILLFLWDIEQKLLKIK